MVITQIQKAVEGWYGISGYHNRKFEDEISSHIYTTYPGDYYVTISFNDVGRMRIDFTFTTPADELLFRLTHL